MDGTEVVHAILQVTHVAEEVLGHFSGRSDGTGRSKWRTVEGICAMEYGRWRSWMAEKVGRDHDEEEDSCWWEYGKEIRVEADEGADCHEGKGMAWVFPGEEPDETCLEDEDDSNAGSYIRKDISRCTLVRGPHRELKRRKLLVIKGMLKPGRPIYFDDLLSGGKSKTSSMFSDGITCCRSLRCRLALHFRNINIDIATTD